MRIHSIEFKGIIDNFVPGCLSVGHFLIRPALAHKPVDLSSSKNFQISTEINFFLCSVFEDWFRQLPRILFPRKLTESGWKWRHLDISAELCRFCLVYFYDCRQYFAFSAKQLLLALGHGFILLWRSENWLGEWGRGSKSVYTSLGNIFFFMATTFQFQCCTLGAEFVVAKWENPGKSQGGK